MENRFGVKDFVLLLLLVILIGVVVLAMFQYDRQWTDVQKIRDQLAEQARDLRDLQRTLARGVTLGGTGGSGAVSTGTRPIASTNPADYGKDDPFARIKAARANPSYAEGDWLVDVAMGQIAKLTPFIASDLYATRVQDIVLETLLARDPKTLDWQPLLATELPKIDDNVDAYNKYVDHETKKGRKIEEIWKDPNLPIPVTMTFTVRQGPQFSDGQPITADDFVWTFNWIMNEKVAAVRDRSAFEKVRSVEKRGTNQIVFKFREPYYDIMTLAGSLPALPRHFYEKYQPEEYNQSVGLLMGSGAYRLEDPTAWKPGSGQVVLVRNERYWGTLPAFDRIVFKEISNDVARQTAFRNGEIDVLEARPEQYHAMTHDPEVMKRSQAHDILSLNGGYRFVAWQELKNGKPTRFADKNVRRAMAMLVNRQRLMQELSLGYAELAAGPFSPAGKQYDPDVKPIPYDVAAAKKLLAGAGYKDTRGDGVLRGPDGQPFHFKLTFPSGSASYEKMALTMKDAYAGVGIVMDLEPLEWAVFTQKLNTKDFEAISLGWGGGNPESDLYQIFDSSQSVTDGDNFICYANPELDQAIRKARTTVDPAKRMPLWRDCQRILNEDQPYMFLWFTKEMYLLDKRIQNVHMGPLGLPMGDRLEWWVPRNQQKWTK